MPKLSRNRTSVAVEALERRRLLSTTYTVIPIGVDISPGGLSSNGIVALYGQSPQGTSDAFVWHDGTMMDLGTDGNYTTAGGVNSSGDVVGEAEVSSGIDHAFYYASGQYHAIPPLGGPNVPSYTSFATGINDSGIIVGSSSVATGGSQGYVTSIGNGTPTNIGTLDPNAVAPVSEADAVNAGGTVVGAASVANAGEQAVSYLNGVLTPYSSMSGASAISDNGIIVGALAASGPPPYPHHAVEVVGSTVTDLGSLGPSDSEIGGYGVNNSGDVVGSYTIDAFLDTRAFIYTGGKLADLNTLLPAGTTETLTKAIAINNAGEILCAGTADSNGAIAFLLKPPGDVNNPDVPSTTPTNTSPLTPTVIRSTAPTALVGGTKLRGVVTVNVTNSSIATVKGANTVRLYATSDGTIDSASVLIGMAKSIVPLKPGKSTPVPILVKSLILPPATYTILAQATDLAGDVAVSATGPTLTVTAPFVSLSGSLSGPTPSSVAPGRIFVVTMTAANAGNVAASGSVSFAVSLPSDPQTVTAPAITIIRSVTVPPGSKPVVIRLLVKVPSSQSAGVFYPYITFTQRNTTFTASLNAALTIT